MMVGRLLEDIYTQFFFFDNVLYCKCALFKTFDIMLLFMLWKNEYTGCFRNVDIISYFNNFTNFCSNDLKF